MSQLTTVNKKRIISYFLGGQCYGGGGGGGGGGLVLTATMMCDTTYLTFSYNTLSSLKVCFTGKIHKRRSNTLMQCLNGTVVPVKMADMSIEISFNYYDHD